MKRIHNRITAGRELAAQLLEYKDQKDVIVLALPRGGVPVGYEISQALNAEFDASLVRKLGVPGQPELAFGAIAVGDIQVFNKDIVSQIYIPATVKNAVIENEKAELNRRNDLYRQGKPAPDLKNKIVILVDDGLATGATMHAAILAVKATQPKKIIIAVPVAPYDTCVELGQLVDNIICLITPEPFYSISLWYDEFPQTSDEEVCELLQDNE